MTDQPEGRALTMPEINAQRRASRCSEACSEQHTYMPPCQASVRPAEHCGAQFPAFEGQPPAECVLRPGHHGSHANHEGTRWITTTPAADDRAALLDRVLDDADHHDRAATQAHDKGIPELMYTQSGIACGLRIAAADIARGRPDLVARLKQRIDQRNPIEPAAGYCPHCGRGDVAPTADEYEEARRRAVRIQTLLDDTRHRIRAIANELIEHGCPWDGNEPEAGRRILTALEPPKETP